MPDLKNLSEYQMYEEMSTEALQQILRDDAACPDGEETDMNKLFCIMDILAQRRKMQNEGKSPEEALESFNQDYRPETTEPKAPRITGFTRLKRGLAAAAAVFAIVIATSLSADAWGFSPWDVIGKWTSETFHFGYALHEETEPPKRPVHSMRELLETSNVTVPLVPTWIPDGYELYSSDCLETPKQTQFYWLLVRGDDVIAIRIYEFWDGHPTQLEKSEETPEIYTVHDVDYYIFKNQDRLVAAWLQEGYECNISGYVTLEEMKKMIDSIWEE